MEIEQIVSTHINVVERSLLLIYCEYFMCNQVSRNEKFGLVMTFFLSVSLPSSMCSTQSVKYSLLVIQTLEYIIFRFVNFKANIKNRFEAGS